jgi:hypothetical protein
MFNDNFDRDYSYEGDARRCPLHPNVATSTPDGMFDMCCHVCESEMDDAAAQEEWMSRPEFDRARIIAQASVVGRMRDTFIVYDDFPF